MTSKQRDNNTLRKKLKKCQRNERRGEKRPQKFHEIYGYCYCLLLLHTRRWLFSYVCPRSHTHTCMPICVDTKSDSSSVDRVPDVASVYSPKRCTQMSWNDPYQMNTRTHIHEYRKIKEMTKKKQYTMSNSIKRSKKKNVVLKFLTNFVCMHTP